MTNPGKRIGQLFFFTVTVCIIEFCRILVTVTFAGFAFICLLKISENNVGLGTVLLKMRRKVRYMYEDLAFC